MLFPLLFALASNPAQAADALALPASPSPSTGLQRQGSVAFGLRGGTYLNGARYSGLYADPGAGLFVRYRPSAGIALEASAQQFIGQRANHTVGGASLVGYLYASKHVSPYATFGLTSTLRTGGLTTDLGPPELLFGGFGGAGLEFALGPKIVIDVDGRYQGHFLRKDDPTLRPGLMGQIGLGFHL